MQWNDSSHWWMNVTLTCYKHSDAQILLCLVRKLDTTSLWNSISYAHRFQQYSNIQELFIRGLSHLHFSHWIVEDADRVFREIYRRRELKTGIQIPEDQLPKSERARLTRRRSVLPDVLWCHRPRVIDVNIHVWSCCFFWEYFCMK